MSELREQIKDVFERYGLAFNQISVTPEDQGDFIIIATETYRVYLNLDRDSIGIGCKRFTCEEWFSFSDITISMFERRDDFDSLAWWRLYKPALMEICEMLEIWKPDKANTS